MRERVCGMLLLATVAGLALPVAGQDAVIRPRTAEAGTVARPARLPYTAEFKTTRVQALPDGNTITHESTRVEALDSKGRTYSETTTIAESDDQTVHKDVNINDPVAKTHTFWFSGGQRVTVSTSGQATEQCAGTPPVAMPQETGEHRATQTSEDLGKQTIQGIEAHGWRTTRTYPEGTIGNSLPLVHTDEFWHSTKPGLNFTVRRVTDDPRSGKETWELVKFTSGEPDVSIFQPPADYQVVTQETHSEVRCP